MKKQIFILLYLFVISISALYGQFEFVTMPPNLLKGANAIIREERQEFDVQSVGKGLERYHVAITILNEKGNKNAIFVQEYSKLIKIRSIEAVLYNAIGKQIRKIKSSDFTDQSTAGGGTLFDDSRVKAVDLSYTEYPYTVVFDYEILRDGLLFYPVWNPQPKHDVAVEKSVFEISLPASMPLRYKAINFPKEPNITNGDKKRYQWEIKNVAAYETEPYTPMKHTNQTIVLTAPTKFEIEGYNGDMSSWESFGKFIATLNEGRHQLPAASVTKFKKLVADCKDDLCKIQKLYDFLQANTRYVNISLGIGGWRPMLASDVDEYKYGDCKALSNYYCAMLEAVGIQGYYTIIGAGEDYEYLLNDFPSSQFNHVVVAVPQGKDTIWVECTSQDEALGYAGRFTGNRDALMITPEGGKLVRTPNYTATDNLQNRFTEFTILPDGTAEATVNTHYTGIQQEYASYMAELPAQQRRDRMYEDIGLKNFEIVAHTFARQKNRLPSVDEKLKLRLPAYAGKSGKRLFVSPNILAQWKSIPTEDSLRQHEVQFLPHAFLDLDTVKMAMPEGYGVERLPEAVQLKSAFGEYEASFVNQGTAVLYCRRLQLNSDVHPKESYAELVDFCKKIQKSDARKVVLVRQE